MVHEQNHNHGLLDEGRHVDALWLNLKGNMDSELCQQVLGVHWNCSSYTKTELNVSSVFWS